MTATLHDPIHDTAHERPEQALAAAVVRVALTDAQGGDTDAASWLASDLCRMWLSLLLPDNTPQATPETLQAQLVGKLPRWMRKEMT